MGLDLRLLPVEHETDGWGFSHSILELGGAGDIYEVLLSTPRLPLPADFTTFCARGKDGEPTYGQTAETPYGTSLDAVTADALSAVLDAVSPSTRRAAVRAYLGALPPATKIALYWH